MVRGLVRHVGTEAYKHGLGLLAIGFNMFGSETELKTDPIHHLFEIYVRINKEKEANPNIDDQARAYFKKMEDGMLCAMNTLMGI